MIETQTFCAGDPVEYAMKGLDRISSHDHRTKKLDAAIEERFGTSFDRETANVIRQLDNSVDGVALLTAAKRLDVDQGQDYIELLDEFDHCGDEADLSSVLSVMNTKVENALADRSGGISGVTSKNQRKDVYLPELANSVAESGGDVYMTKTMSTTGKVQIAWDLDDVNEVIVVDSYSWGELFDWKKLKSLPHGKNKIREELGDKLSQEVLDKVAGQQTSDTETTTTDSSGATKRRTRTKPTDEVLNVARSSSHSSRFKMQAKEIKEAFDTDGYIGSSYKKVGTLVLFPSTADENLSAHYWIGGSGPDGQRAAIANCNKGTFEYLNDCEQVLHIEDYLTQAEDYEFQTNHGPVTLSTVDNSQLVLHAVSEESKQRLMRKRVIENLPETLVEYCQQNRRTPPELPHSDDMLYAPITTEDVFWLRPALRKMQSPDDGGAVILYAGGAPRDIGKKYNISSDYKLYARARLPDWDFDGEELSTLDSISYSLDMDHGAYELVETLAKLHDAGEQPFSQTPQARWTQ